GEAVSLAYGWHADDVQGHVEVAYQLPNDAKLLIVLLTEHGDIRRRRAEQLGAHGSNAAEEVGTKIRLEAMRSPCRHDSRCKPVRVHVSGSRRPNQLARLVCELCQVPGFISRI